MDKFAAEPAEIRAELFTETAARMGVSPQIIEKDFWVCWTLRTYEDITERAEKRIQAFRLTEEIKSPKSVPWALTSDKNV